MFPNQQSILPGGIICEIFHIKWGIFLIYAQHFTARSRLFTINIGILIASQYYS